MEREDAVAMLQSEYLKNGTDIQVWADFGCGSGTFTLALASLLPHESIIHAIDQDKSSLKQIPSIYQSINIEKLNADFVNDPLSLKDLDGILMANSLHYVRDKISFIKKIKSYLKSDGRLLLVEYDTETPVPVWVPYPISFTSLKKMFTDEAYREIKKLHERKSVFGKMMYSALVIKN